MSSALEGMLGGVLRQFGGGSMAGIVGKIAPALIGMLAGGGAQKLVSQFKESGLAGHADSWVGTGDNKPISPDQVTQALGEQQVSQFAEQAGIPKEQAGAVLAEALPKAIDQLSPSGQLPDAAQVDQALNATAGS